MVLFAYSTHSQVYELDALATGGMGIAVATPITYGSVNISFSHLNETVILDPVGQTARQIGTITSTASSTGYVLNETQLVPSAFPQPPTPVSATISINLSLADGGVKFDTGAQPATWNAAVQAYSINGQIGNIPVVGSYSLMTGGKTYTGNFSYYLYNVLGSAFTYRILNTQGYPNQIALSVTGTEGGFFSYVPSVSTVADVFADNGFHMVLSPQGTGFGWGAADAIAVVPEPSEYATGV